jgi:hypothetical protein
MNRRMKEISVRTNQRENLIYLGQPTDDPGNCDDNEIILTPEQVPTLIEWLQQALQDIETGEE